MRPRLTTGLPLTRIAAVLPSSGGAQTPRCQGLGTTLLDYRIRCLSFAPPSERLVLIERSLGLSLAVQYLDQVDYGDAQEGEEGYEVQDHGE